MKKELQLQPFIIILVFFISVNILSCSSPKNITYFRDIPDSGQLKTVAQMAYIEPKIQADDILTILVSTVDPAATQMINIGNVPINASATPMVNPSASVQSNQISGYLVNKEGDVEVPILGKLHIAGLTTNQAKEVVRAKAAEFYKDPSVIVRYSNFKITVTGEVAKPSIYVMPNEKVTLLDALSIAGDLTIYGKRDNILLLRDNEQGSKTAYRINLTKSNIVNEPYYYLKQNDYIYVEPSKGKAIANDIGQTRNIAIFTSVLTVLIVLISRINF